MHIFKAYLHGRFPTSWDGLGLSLLNIVVAYLYCIVSLHMFIAYVYCISLKHTILHISVVVSLSFVVWVLSRFLVVWECLGSIFGRVGVV